MRLTTAQKVNACVKDFLSKLEPRSRRATGRESGYDPDSVDRYLEIARLLALQDMLGLLAHAATMARAFLASGKEVIRV